MKEVEKKQQKKFDTVIFFRKIKEKISRETQEMTFEQFKEYLKQNKLNVAK